MSVTREQIYSALFAAASGAYPWASPPSRRLKLWSDVPAEQRPALFQFEGDPDKYVYASGSTLASQKRTIFAKLFVYIDTKEPATIGATQINPILDALDAALAPTAADAEPGKFSLGGLVDNCRVAGVLLKDPGDLEGDGLLIIQIEMVLP